MEIQLKTLPHLGGPDLNRTVEDIRAYQQKGQRSRIKQLEGQCQIKSFEPLKFDYVKTILVIVPIIISFFGLLLIKHYKKLRVKAFYKSCEYSQAEYFYIESKDGNEDIEKVIFDEDQKQFVQFKKLKYRLYREELIPVGYQFENDFGKIISKDYMSYGLSFRNCQDQAKIYGKNEHKVQIPSYFQYTFDILTKPFFILQYIICIVFIFQKLVNFTIINVSFSVITTSINYFLLYNSYLKIKEMAEKEVDVKVIRNGEKFNIKNHDLVPGDVVIPSQNDEITFDGILVQGQIFVNESSLTGESIPIGKFPARELSNTKKQTPWIVQGAKVLQVRPDSRVVVINTGYSTRRGRIIRKILTRTTKVPDFFNSAVIFLIETFAVAVIIYFSTLYLMIEGKIITTFIIYRFLDYLGWSFPPTFPIFFNVSYSFSLVRLKWRNIFGTEPQKVTQAANVKTFFFDKTGTLTQNQIQVFEIYKFADGKHLNITKSINIDDDNQLIQKLFASCHTVRQINNEFLGDQVDLRMFLYSQYKMKPSDDNNIRFTVQNRGTRIQILRINQFQSKFQNMSVLVRDTKLNKYYVFVKGAPQRIQSNSTNKIPTFNDLVSKLSLGGYRTIGYGYKQVSQSEIKKYMDGQRQIFDTDILALGLVAFQNKLKSDTRDTIDKLVESDIIPKMITGDNIFIAVETGFRAGILKQGEKIILLQGKKQVNKTNRHFQGILLFKKDRQIVQETIDFSQRQYQTQNEFAIAIDNDFFNMYPKPFITPYIKLFARISPENKANIVKIFKQQQKEAFKNKSCSQRWFGPGVQKVGMCGDGANDLMAIREADVGVGISDSDASYAACFTITKMLDVDHIVRQSKNANQSIVDMIRYFGTINFIKIVASILLVLDVTYYTNNQTIFFNFAHSVWISIAFSLSSAHELPTKKRPLCNFMSLYNHLIYWTAIILPSLGMCLGYYYIRNSQIYTSNLNKSVSDLLGYQGTLTQTNTIVWLMLNFILISSGFILYKGQPFRSGFYKNAPIMILTIGNFIAIIVFFFMTRRLERGLNLYEIPNYQSGICLAIIASSMITTFFAILFLKKKFHD